MSNNIEIKFNHFQKPIIVTELEKYNGNKCIKIKDFSKQLQYLNEHCCSLAAYFPDREIILNNRGTIIEEQLIYSGPSARAAGRRWAEK